MLRNLSAGFQHTLGCFPAVFKDRPVLQCYGHPIPKTLVIWAPPSHITLAIWVRVRVKVKGDAHFTS